ncbi:MAG: hypothetical protein GY711_04555 [bacterium]|nr:hypothetical protein [bacterium]
MSDGVEQEEVEAIREAVEPLAVQRKAVETRDFRRPRRLSRAHLSAVKHSLEVAMPKAAAAIATPLRKTHKLTIASVSETDAGELFDSLVPPFLVYGFPCGMGRGWLVWDTAPAAATCETILSGTVEGDGDAAARSLSPTERRVARSLLDALVAPITRSLGLHARSGALALERDELSTLAEESPTADTRRLLVHMMFEGPGAPSEMRVYVPAKFPAIDPFEVEDEAPEHLEEVPFELSATLGSVEVSLAELMRLEVGDVIPLGVTKGESIQIHIGERARATAQWGRHQGRLAIRIEDLQQMPPASGAQSAGTPPTGKPSRSSGER